MKIKSCPINKPIKGSITLPGDKSISHRSIIISSISNGRTIISNILKSEDVNNTLKVIKNLGVKTKTNKNNLYIYGKGLKSLKKPKKILYMGNSGTSARLLIGLLAGQNFNSIILGDKSLSKRPMGRIIKPLSKMGAKIQSNNNKLPIKIFGSMKLKASRHLLNIPSAQIKSGLLLASLNIYGKTKIVEKWKTRDHTEIMLKSFKAKISLKKQVGSRIIELTGKKELKATKLNIPGDFSSAAFLIVAALIQEGSSITLKNVNLNPTRIGLLKTLVSMGGNIKIKNTKYQNGEKVGNIFVKYSKLKGCNLNSKITPTMIDEYPILSVAASCASGPSIFRGLNELKVKESNRLKLINENLIKCGVNSKIKGSDLIIHPSNFKINKIIKVKTNQDHRIAMSFAILGMKTKKGIIIDNAEYINTSFPNFVKTVNKLGARIINWKESL